MQVDVSIFEYMHWNTSSYRDNFSLFLVFVVVVIIGGKVIFIVASVTCRVLLTAPPGGILIILFQQINLWLLYASRGQYFIRYCVISRPEKSQYTEQSR